MKVVIILLCIIAFILCLLFGVFAGNLSTHSPTSPSPSPTAVMIPSSGVDVIPANPDSLGQRTLILVAADNLAKTSPRLIGVWIAAFFPSTPQIIFLPLYPSETGAASTGIQTLTASFGITDQGGLAPSFEQALRSFINPYNGYIVTDRDGLIAIVGSLHGLDLGDGNGLRDGKSVVAALTSPWEDPNNSLKGQKLILNGFCARWKASQGQIEWLTILANLGPEHVHTNLPVSIFTDDWKTLSSHATPIKCEVPSIK